MVEKKLDEIEMEETLKNIEARLQKIEETLAETQKDCSKMSSHITFIERTYETLRLPLNYIKSYIGYPKELPVIENKEKE